jgi:uncharacterized protein YeeX (DUF496 family)
MEYGEVLELINALRCDFEDKIDCLKIDLQETIDNLRGEVDRLSRSNEMRGE